MITSLILATISIHIIPILVAILIAALLWWLVGWISPPELINRIARGLIIVVFVLWLLHDMGLIGGAVNVSSIPQDQLRLVC